MLLDQVERVRFLERAGREASVRSVGGGGKDGGVILVSCAIVPAGEAEDRWRCRSRVRRAVTRVSSV